MIKKFLWLILVFVLCLGFTGAARAGLVAYYPFDGDINDYSGYGKNGVYWSGGSSTATPSFTSGKLGQAISLQPFDSYDTDGIPIGTRIEQGVILPDETYFDLPGGISISCWVKFSSRMGVYPGGGFGEGWFAALVTKSRASDQWSMQTNWNTGAQRMMWRIGHTAGATSITTVRPGTTDDTIHLCVDEYDNPTWNVWYHVVTTYSSDTGVMKVYFNGEPDPTNTATSIQGDKSIGDRNNIQAAAAIGIYAKSDYTPWGTDDSYSDSHDGLIDDVAIFDTVLTDANVQFIYETSVSAFISGALAGISESEGSTNVCEGGLLAPETDSYTIKMYKRSAGDPNITVTLGYDSDQITVDPTSAIITEASSWQALITVTAVNDSDVEGPHYSTIAHTVSCSDPNGADYNWGHDTDKLRDVVVAIQDDEQKTVIVAESGDSTEVAETFSTSDSYTVSLGGVPSASVTLNLTYDSDQVTLSPTGLTFTTGNWYLPQTVTVTAVDDEVLESYMGQTHTTVIEGSCTGGGYDAVEVADVTVDITDDEPYCGDPNTTAMRSVADISGPDGTWDCYIDLYDLAKMANDWLICIDPTDDDCDPNLGGTWPEI